MKKLLFCFVLLLLSIPNIYSEDLREMDYREWRMIEEESKEWLIAGYILGTWAMVLQFEGQDLLSIEETEPYVLYVEDISAIRRKINSFYRKNEDKRDWPVMILVYAITKEAWNYGEYQKYKKYQFQNKDSS